MKGKGYKDLTYDCFRVINKTTKNKPPKEGKNKNEPSKKIKTRDENMSGAERN